MKCAACQSENSAGAKFCSECGAPMARTCPSCGSTHPPGAKFCSECGASLTPRTAAPASEGSAAPPAAPPSPSHAAAPSAGRSGRLAPADAERRQLTVMFCDLVSSTELSARLDPEDLREVIREFQREAEAAIVAQEGHVAQHLGDGLLVYFGYPKAHEDAAIRSAHAGLDIASRIEELNQRLTASHDVSLAVRVGIHTGPTVVGAMGGAGGGEQLAIGETPNLAARLQGAAAPGRILVSAETAHLIDRAFELSDLGTVEMKGFASPRHVYQVERPVEPRHGVAVVDAVTTPFVGREAELSALVMLWQEARQGSGRSVFIRGDAGVGKSRLCARLWAAIAAEGGDRVVARGSPYLQNSALRPIADLMTQLLDIGEGTADARLATLRERVAELGMGLDPAVALLADLLELPGAGEGPALSPQARRARTIELMLQVVAARGRQRPLAILIEDLHWTDQSTLAFLGTLLERLAEWPVLLVCTSRPYFSPPWQVDTEIALNRLTRDAVERIVRHVTGGRPLPPALTQQIVLKADGNPLFVEELTRMILHSGLLEESAGQLGPSAVAAALTIPSTLQDSLMARLDQLPPALKALVQLCSTIGRQFSYDLLLEILRSFEEDMQNEVRRLTDGELLFQRGLPPRSMFVFKHALMQDAAYSSLLRRTRVAYHGRVADVLGTHFPDTPDEVIAHHLTEAGRASEAIDRWVGAGRRALGTFALAEALAHLHRGLGLVGQVPDPVRRVEAELSLRVLLNVPLMLTQGFAAPDVEANATRMLALCEEAGNRAIDQQFAALWALWTFHEVSGQYGRAAEMGQRLSTLADLTGDSGMRLAAHTAVGAAVLMQGQLSESLHHFEAGLAVYDRERHGPLALLFGQDAGAMCASFLTWVHSLDGATDRARAHADEALALCDALGQPGTRGFVETVLATWCCLEGAFDRAVAHADTVVRLAAEQGMPHWDAQATIARGWALAGLGRGAEGIETMQRSIAALLAIGSRASMTFYWAGLAEAQLVAGDTAGARGSLDEALEIVRRGEERIYEPGLYLLAGRIARAERGADAVAEARKAFTDGLAAARAEGSHRLAARIEAELQTLAPEPGRTSV